MARPSKYQPQATLAKIKALDPLQTTDVQIAAHLGIGMSALYEWKNRYPKFAEALNAHKQTTNEAVENAMVKRAMGFDFDEVTTVKDAKGKVTSKKTITKHYPPDPTSCIFFLKNRLPDKYRNDPDPLPQEDQVADVIRAPLAGPPGEGKQPNGKQGK